MERHSPGCLATGEGRCEYCQMPQAFDDASFEIDHIVSRKHHGPTVASNLA